MNSDPYYLTAKDPAMGSRLIFFRKYYLVYIEDPTLKGHTMSYSLLILFAVIVIQAICAFFAFRENRKLKKSVAKLARSRMNLYDAADKNEEFIQELIKTNQAQAKKIRELKNRISF